MFKKTRRIGALSTVALAVFLFGCDEEKADTPAPAVTSAPVVAATTATASAPAPTQTAAKPSHECPEGSAGEGTFKNPCLAKGKARMMEVKWTGKIDDKGPSFKVESKSKLEILYGQLMVYFYDKAGKQLEVPVGGEDKTHLQQKCVGNIFAGPMKPGEKAVLTFSCVKKSHVPEGTAHIEGELRMVGFTGKESKKSDTFWRNDDLTPDERPKGGIK